MKKILAAFLMAVLLASPAGTASHKPKAFDSVRALAWTVHQIVGFDSDTDQAVTIDEFGNHCTVTSINEQDHFWLTAAHCVSNDDMTEVDYDEDYMVGDSEGGYTPAIVIDVDLAQDMAILETPEVGLPAIKVSKHDVFYGDKLSVVSHPFGWPAAAVFFGTVSHPGLQFDPDDKVYMIYQLGGAPGSSGSAVMNDKGEIVSVLQIGWTRSFGNVMGGSPWKATRDFVAPYIP